MTFNLLSCAKTQTHQKKSHANAHISRCCSLSRPLAVTVQLTMHSVRDKWECEEARF